MKEVGSFKHRIDSDRAKAHAYVIAHIDDARPKVIAAIEKNFQTTPSTAISWYQAFKRDARNEQRKAKRRAADKRRVRALKADKKAD